MQTHHTKTTTTTRKPFFSHENRFIVKLRSSSLFTCFLWMTFPSDCFLRLRLMCSLTPLFFSLCLSWDTKTPHYDHTRREIVLLNTLMLSNILDCFGWFGWFLSPSRYQLFHPLVLFCHTGQVCVVLCSGPCHGAANEDRCVIRPWK